MSVNVHSPGDVSRLVLGTWGLAGAGTRERSSYGEVSERTAWEVFDAAWEAGLRRIDTARSYGDGDGLKRLRAWQRRTGCQWQIVAKPGRPIGEAGPASTTSARELIAEIQQVAALAGTPDVVLVKDPPAEHYADGLLEDTLDELEDVLAEARVGVASHRPDLACSLRPGTRQRVAQVELNGVNRAFAVPPVVSGRRQRGDRWEVWTMQPLAYGYLADPTREPTADDWRSRIPQRSQQVLRVTSSAFTGRLRSLLAPVDADVASLAIAYCLSVPGVARTVVGPRDARQLESSLAALRLIADEATRTALIHFVDAEFPDKDR